MPDQRRRCILIYGNSGSGKTTMARRLSQQSSLGWLSLDDIAWRPDTETPVRRAQEECGALISEFMEQHVSWVMDGCYGNLIGYALPYATELRFLNPGVEACLSNCRKRPWEPDKFPSKEAQDAMLETLISWVKEYEFRDDDCSLIQHQELFDSYAGQKKVYRRLADYD